MTTLKEKLTAVVSERREAIELLQEIIRELEDLEHDHFGCHEPDCLGCRIHKFLERVTP